jgi:hypothetical protein
MVDQHYQILSLISLEQSIETEIGGDAWATAGAGE